MLTGAALREVKFPSYQRQTSDATRSVHSNGWLAHSRFASDSVHFIMRTDREQEDSFDVPLLHELEDDAEVVTGTRRPVARKVTFEFVRSQARIESIVLKLKESLPDRFRRNGLPLGKARLAARTNAGDGIRVRFTTRSCA